VPSIILSFPYSGALYRYFTDQLGSGSLQEPVTHRYYRTLFGRNASNHIELALNFLLLYDKVYVTPADNHWPTSRLNPTDKYTVTELGLTADWEDFQAKDQQAYTQYLDYLCHHESITKLLGQTFKLAKRDWRQILDQCIYESGLSARKRIPILCSAGRRVLIQELVSIQAPSLHPIFSRQSEVKFIESYRTLSGMALMPRNLDELMDAKPDKAVRQYGNALVNASTELGKVCISPHQEAA
jgi:hypothetical protein